MRSSRQGLSSLKVLMGSFVPAIVWMVMCLGAGVAAPDICHADWRPYRLDRWVQAKVTAYCPGPCCCGAHANGRTSTGRDAALPGVAVAPRAVPYGSLIWLDGVGFRLADDTGGAMRRSWRGGVIHLDLRHQTHASARAWGVRQRRVAIYRPSPPRANVDSRTVSRRAPGAPRMSAMAQRRRETVRAR